MVLCQGDERQKGCRGRSAKRWLIPCWQNNYGSMACRPKPSVEVQRVRRMCKLSCVAATYSYSSASGRVSTAQLGEQVSKRLGQFPQALGVLGVVYPDRLQAVEDIQESLVAADDLKWRLYGSRGATTPDQSDHSGLRRGALCPTSLPPPRFGGSRPN